MPQVSIAGTLPALPRSVAEKVVNHAGPHARRLTCLKGSRVKQSAVSCPAVVPSAIIHALSISTEH